MVARSHCQALDKGRVCTEGFIRKQPNPTPRRGLSAQEKWAVRREGEQAVQDTVPSRQREGGRGAPPDRPIAPSAHSP